MRYCPARAWESIFALVFSPPRWAKYSAAETSSWSMKRPEGLARSRFWRTAMRPFPALDRTRRISTYPSMERVRRSMFKTAIASQSAVPPEASASRDCNAGRSLVRPDMNSSTLSGANVADGSTRWRCSRQAAICAEQEVSPSQSDPRSETRAYIW
ncbi:MAG: hypothetical protein FWG50_05795 [Kiritimatiellaeota bacterium]|nr:hypothetical protein [Kiritimatiellota bacterium]